MFAILMVYDVLTKSTGLKDGLFIYIYFLQIALISQTALYQLQRAVQIHLCLPDVYVAAHNQIWLVSGKRDICRVAKAADRIITHVA